jgi:PIN domain nuclease of toxin-antitoxin system
MRLLLDTHALLWWLGGDARLPARARAAIGDQANAVLVSAASAWEVATKVRIGRLPGGEFIAAELASHVVAQGFEGLDVTLDHGQRAGLLPGPLRDPFDRMLVAQARCEGLRLASSDTKLAAYDVDLVD